MNLIGQQDVNATSAYGGFLAYGGEPHAGGAMIIVGAIGMMGRASIPKR